LETTNTREESLPKAQITIVIKVVFSRYPPCEET
jgi:hypothetical protein